MYALILVDWLNNSSTIIAHMAEIDHCRIFVEELTKQIGEYSGLTYECIEKELD